jgi:predicted kinase
MKQAQTREDVQLLRESLQVRYKYPEPTAVPVLVAVSGLPGSGKSYFCRQLSARLRFPIVESDVMRKELVPVPTHSPTESQRLFQACHMLIKDLLQKGISVIFDATNLVEHHREQLYRIADSIKAKLIFIRVEAPPELVRQRLHQRQSDIDPADSSDADWGVYQKMSRTVQPIQRNYFAVDTSKDIEPVIDKIVREVNR